VQLDLIWLPIIHIESSCWWFTGTKPGPGKQHGREQEEEEEESRRRF